MATLLGKTELETVKLRNHLSSASTGIKEYGISLDSLENGLLEGFQGKNLCAIAAGTYTVAANQAMAITKTYIIENASQHLRVNTSTAADSVKSPDFDTGAGIVDSLTSNHSVYRVLCANTDADTTGCVAVMDQSDILWIPPSNNFKVGFEIAAWDNRTQDRLFVMNQIGVCGALHANKLVLDSAAMDDGTNPISGGNFMYAELAAGKMRIVHGTGTAVPTLGTQYDVPSGAFSIILHYVFAMNAVQVYIDANYSHTEYLTQWATPGALQFFMRSGNSAGYGDATMLPCDISVDAILVSVPRSN